MNLENIKKSGARRGLCEEADIMLQNIKDYQDQYKYYECEQKTKELQLIYAELQLMSKEK